MDWNFRYNRTIFSDRAGGALVNDFTFYGAASWWIFSSTLYAPLQVQQQPFTISGIDTTVETVSVIEILP